MQGRISRSRRAQDRAGPSGPAGNFCPTRWCWTSCFRSGRAGGLQADTEFSYCSILFLSSKTTISIRFSAFPAAATITSQNPSAPGGGVPREGPAPPPAVPGSLPAAAGLLLTAGPISVDRDSGRAYKDGRELDLTGREFLAAGLPCGKCG